MKRVKQLSSLGYRKAGGGAVDACSNPPHHLIHVGQPRDPGTRDDVSVDVILVERVHTAAGATPPTAVRKVWYGILHPYEGTWN